MKKRESKQTKTAVSKAKPILYKRYFVLLGAFILTWNVFAQKTTITGTVKDTKNEPLIGVSIKIKGATGGAVTNFDGKFTLEAAATDVLVVSYVGMDTQEITVGTSKDIQIVMTEDNKTLEEVVVVGYGTQKKKDLTTAVSSVSTKDLDQRPLVSADQALLGKASGVSVIKPNGLPGANMVIRVRGTTSMNSSNDPLYVVDGVTLDDISFLSANVY